jgi:hypothetical protein
MIREAILGFHDTLRTHIVARGNGVVAIVFVNPFFVPYPGIFVQAKKLASRAVANRAKQLAADFGFLPDKLTITPGTALRRALRGNARKKAQCHRLTARLFRNIPLDRSVEAEAVLARVVAGLWQERPPYGQLQLRERVAAVGLLPGSSHCHL